MDTQKVDMFVMINSKYFENTQIMKIRESLLNLDESKWIYVQSLQFKEPTISFIISLVAGIWGVDRFFVGDIGLGILKLLTIGGLGIWVFIDWFLIMGVTREKNLRKIMSIW